eukprot:1368305-Amphidinium_carterae.1
MHCRATTEEGLLRPTYRTVTVPQTPWLSQDVRGKSHLLSNSVGDSSDPMETRACYNAVIMTPMI